MSRTKSPPIDPVPGQRLKELKEEFHLTSAELGSIMGYGDDFSDDPETIRRNSVSRIFHGRVKLDTERAKLVIQYINKHIDNSADHIRLEWLLDISDDKTEWRALRSRIYSNADNWKSEYERGMELLIGTASAAASGFTAIWNHGNECAMKLLGFPDERRAEILISQEQYDQLRKQIEDYSKFVVGQFINSELQKKTDT